MFYLSKPDNHTVERFLLDSVKDTFSYNSVGATDGIPPSGYSVDHNRILLGKGIRDLERARDAIRRWQMFAFNWISLVHKDTPIEVGRSVAIVVQHFGFYSMSSARVVYVIDEPEKRFGFAYGTLNAHVESGEERFSVEFDPATEEVWYDLLAFSRPNATLAKLGYPLGRYLQRSFIRDSKLAMLAAVSPNDPRVLK